LKVDNQVIHHTDFSFQKSLYYQFGINRGVYNTIEQWFFDHGYTEVTGRRTEIIKFLRCVSERFHKNGKLIFGSGRLTSCLEEYSDHE